MWWSGGLGGWWWLFSPFSWLAEQQGVAGMTTACTSLHPAAWGTFVRVIVRKISVYSCRKMLVMNWFIYMLKNFAPTYDRFFFFFPFLSLLTFTSPLLSVCLLQRSFHVRRLAACICKQLCVSCWLLVTCVTLGEEVWWV